MIALNFPTQNACLMWQRNFSSNMEIQAFYNSNVNHRLTAFSPIFDTVLLSLATWNCRMRGVGGQGLFSATEKIIYFGKGLLP